MEDVISVPAADKSATLPRRSDKEREFVRRLADIITGWTNVLDGAEVRVERPLEYAAYRFEYLGTAGSKFPKAPVFKTDLMIFDTVAGDTWIPRIVIECKYGAPSTHDLLTYSQKADAHRALHPYLRYGFVIGASTNPTISFKMLRHGRTFDFLSVLPTEDTGQLEVLHSVIGEELRASRMLWKAYRAKRLPAGIHLVHRALGFLPTSSCESTKKVRDLTNINITSPEIEEFFETHHYSGSVRDWRTIPESVIDPDDD